MEDRKNDNNNCIQNEDMKNIRGGKYNNKNEIYRLKQNFYKFYYSFFQ